MKIKQLFQKNKTVFSCEVFPPKKDSPIETIYKTLDGLQPIQPDYISVTFGAGGNVLNQPTGEIASIIQNEYHIPSVAHLTCLNYSKEEVATLLEQFKNAGIENILALRGDRNPDFAPQTDFRYASELITFIKERGDFNISAACYPEGHVESETLVQDILDLRKKVDAGADNLVSQLFFDNEDFYSFLDRAHCAGVDVPIQAGIMPVLNQKQVERMVSMCGSALPSKLTRMLSRYGENPEALRAAGIAYATEQISELIAAGVDGIHLYTMNNPEVATTIYNCVKSLLQA